MSYIPSNWYWTPPIGQNTGEIYSSAVGGLVSTGSADYIAWLAAGNVATPCPRDTNGVQQWADLDWVLEQAGLPLTGFTPPTKAGLLVYANAKVAVLLGISRTYSVAAAGGGIAATVKSDCATATGADLLALNVWGALNPTETQPWVDDFGAVTPLTGDQFQELGLSVQAYGASVWTVMATAATEIAAGSIITTAQIDSLSWPV